MPDQTLTTPTTDVCGEIGTSWPNGEPIDTPPCALPAGHTDLTHHDWATREDAHGLDTVWAGILDRATQTLSREATYSLLVQAYLHGHQHGADRNTAAARATAAEQARQQLANELATMTEVAQSNKRHVAYLTAEVESLTAGRDQYCRMEDRVRALLVTPGGDRDDQDVIDDAPPAGLGSSSRAQGIDPERMAAQWYRTYESLGVQHGHVTQRVAWEDLPEVRRDVLVETCRLLLAWLDRGAPGGVDEAEDQGADIDVEQLLATAREGLAAADTDEERAEVIESLLADWYAHWPASAVTPPEYPISRWLVTTLTPPADATVRGLAGVEQAVRHLTDVVDRLTPPQPVELVELRAEQPARRTDAELAAIVANALQPYQTGLGGRPLALTADAAGRIAVEALADEWALGVGGYCGQCGTALPRATGDPDQRCVTCWSANPDDPASIPEPWRPVIEAAVDWRATYRPVAPDHPGIDDQERALLRAVDELLRTWPGVDLSLPAVSIAEVHAESQELATGGPVTARGVATVEPDPFDHVLTIQSYGLAVGHPDRCTCTAVLREATRLEEAGDLPASGRYRVGINDIGDRLLLGDRLDRPTVEEPDRDHARLDLPATTANQDGADQ